MYMEEKKYLNKWIVFQPSYGYRMTVNRVIVAYCFKETTKQIKCVENKQNRMHRISDMTVSKELILAIVSEDKVQDIRDYAKKLHTDYYQKVQSIYDTYQQAMLNFPK